MRRMMRVSSLRSRATGSRASAPKNETLENIEGDGLGLAAHFVHRPRARRAAAPAATGLEGLEPPRQEIRQHLEDALGQADAPRLVVVEVDGGREVLTLAELGAHGIPGRHGANLRRRA